MDYPDDDSDASPRSGTTNQDSEIYDDRSAALSGTDGENSEANAAERASAVVLEQKDEGGGTNPANAGDNENNEEEDGDEEEATDEEDSGDEEEDEANEILLYLPLTDPLIHQYNTVASTSVETATKIKKKLPSRYDILHVERAGVFRKVKKRRPDALTTSQNNSNRSAFMAACLSNRNRAVPYYSWKTVTYATAQAVICGLSLMQVVFVMTSPAESEAAQMQAMGNCIFFFRALFYVLATMAAVGSLEPVIFPKDVGQSDSIGFTIAPYTVLFGFNGVTLMLTLSVSGFDNAMLVALNSCRSQMCSSQNNVFAKPSTCMSRVEGLDISCDKYPFSDLLSESEGLFSYWKVVAVVRALLSVAGFVLWAYTQELSKAIRRRNARADVAKLRLKNDELLADTLRYELTLGANKAEMAMDELLLLRTRQQDMVKETDNLIKLRKKQMDV